MLYFSNVEILMTCCGRVAGLEFRHSDCFFFFKTDFYTGASASGFEKNGILVAGICCFVCWVGVLFPGLCHNLRF